MDDQAFSPPFNRELSFMSKGFNHSSVEEEEDWLGSVFLSFSWLAVVEDRVLQFLLICCGTYGLVIWLHTLAIKLVLLIWDLYCLCFGYASAELLNVVNISSSIAKGISWPGGTPVHLRESIEFSTFSYLHFINRNKRPFSSKSSFIHRFLSDAALRLHRLRIQTSYTMKYRHCDGKLVLKVSDNREISVLHLGIDGINDVVLCYSITLTLSDYLNVTKKQWDAITERNMDFFAYIHSYFLLVADMNCSLSYVYSALPLCVVELESSSFLALGVVLVLECWVTTKQIPISICSIVFAKLPSTSLVARENMAETILVDIAGNVLSSLGSYAIQHIGFLCGVKGELRKMQNNISTIKNVLLDAQEQQMSSHAVKEWLERLKLTLYDAEDLLDEVATETKRRQMESLLRKVHYFFTSSNPLVFRYVVGRKIRDIGKRLDEIVLQMNAFKFVVKLVERPIQINRREETSSFVNTVTVIGRDADKEKLVRLLLSPGDEENVAIVPIVGMGGLGKTTLAQLVYNDDRIQKHFTQRLWVCISNDFDVRRILIKLLQAGDAHGDTSYSNEGLEQLQNRVRSLLREDKFLLFLDDVWNEDCVEWKKLEDLLITQARGSRIIVTTRMACKEGDESKHPNLVNIGKKIVEKCGGVPLAARTLGAFLFSKTNERDWLFVRDNEMWAIVQKENDILPILRLSYDQMPSYLKHCFAYCSLLEKDEIIYGTKLIYEWMALGFVQCVDTKDELEDIGEGYILELVRRSFLEGDYTMESFYHYINPVKRERYKMHDLVHDLAQYVAGNEFLTVKGSTTEAIPKTVRHISFDLNTYCPFSRPLMDAKQLRTICLPKEEIGRLTSLRTLYLYECDNLESLGEGIEHLSCLRDLVIKGCNKLVSLPAGFRHLTSLERLEIAHCASLNLSEDDDLKGLISLKELELCLLPGLVNLPKGLLDAAATLTRLEIVLGHNFSTPSESILPNLLSLQSLTIRECHKVKSLPEGMQRLTKLQDLNIYGCILNYTIKYREGGEDWPKIAHVADKNCLLSYVCSALLLCAVELESSGFLVFGVVLVLVCWAMVLRYGIGYFALFGELWIITLLCNGIGYFALIFFE
ncbi:hypothetical protein RHSIM_Rhsim03G0042400 [Rhododendron simsii]|uniref:Disease resistance protein RGA3 n=1 Tax=Rhododendron simsii TaxID=118357 RepID=A0A834LQF0_RHOSS|nr:hypothetical protein RHSIM_Rhsim03G0042400 [Rhododendron simsii]